MNQQERSELTGKEPLPEAKKMKSTPIINAVFIGFLIGIVLYSILNNSFGFLMLIPLLFAYRLINKSKTDNQELESRINND